MFGIAIRITLEDTRECKSPGKKTLSYSCLLYQVLETVRELAETNSLRRNTLKLKKVLHTVIALFLGSVLVFLGYALEPYFLPAVRRGALGDQLTIFIVFLMIFLTAIVLIYEMGTRYED